jgi:2-oxoglutarate dehydrogenase E2 component (dihydrolipoamide succinyltransferase)
VAEIRVPKLNNNDDSYILLEWLAPDGGMVGADEALVSLETSKAVEELASAEGGVLRHGMPAGTQCAPGTVIGRIAPPGSAAATATASAAPPVPAPPGPAAAWPGATGAEPVITEPARQLINARGISIDDVRALGVKIVRRADIEAMAPPDETSLEKAGPATSAYELPPVQRAVARTVTRSHDTIPAAYTVVQVDMGAAQGEAKRLTKAHRALIGLPEFLVAAVSRLRETFPVFFASPAGADALDLAADAHVGVTIDVGKGLYIPVVKNAAQRTVPEIAQLMAGFRQTATEGRFSEQDLSGGNIIITLHTDLDVVLAIPLILPGQTCALALAGPRRIVVPDGEHSTATRVVANLGLAYDHRFINGREAMAFLRAAKALLESPGQLA